MLTLNRTSKSPDGVFGLMISEEGRAYFTLEHAYVQSDGSIEPKVALGTYICSRHAPNRLPYDTFELNGVPDFMGSPVSGILIHIGNYNQNSDGCIMLGTGQTDAMITNSKEAFDDFMSSLEGIDSFELTIK